MAARVLGPLIRAHADQIEADRCLSSGIARALTEAGLFRMLVPRSLGGGEADLETFLQVVEEVSQADGSVGWCVATLAWQTAHVVWLSEEVAWDLVGRDPNAVLSGTLAAPGRAVIVTGGYRVTGQWRFASGCHYATWHIGYAALFDGETRVLAEDGTPAFRLMLVPAAERAIIDTWQVTGMRGTGSHDVAVTDVFVPADHSYQGGSWTRNATPVCCTASSLISLPLSSRLSLWEWHEPPSTRLSNCPMSGGGSTRPIC
jgi:alkylation response protein AidB-like acyl-CoA dehydrogenase